MASSVTPPASIAPRNSSGHAPLRRPNSVRRTTSIDVTWPAGQHSSMHLAGQARDIYTNTENQLPRVLRHDRFTANLSPERIIEQISSEPPRPALQQLIGAKCGNAFRKELSQALHQEQEQGTPLYALLDDLAGTSLISSWAWSRWEKNKTVEVTEPDNLSSSEIAEQARARQEHTDRFENVCIGFRSGSNALLNFSHTEQNCQIVKPLPHPEDPEGWHTMADHSVVSMRRARRIDMWQEENIHIDAMFQDSGSLPGGGRAAVHEYTLQLEVDAKALTITAIDVEPRVLPFPECPAAKTNVNRLLGASLYDLRTTVLEKLRREAGCTHLNDALRSLAELPTLLPAIHT